MAGPDPHPRLTWTARLLGALRNNFIAGVVVIAPIGLTVWLIWTAVGWVDDVVMPFVPRYYHPDVALNRWLGNARGSEEWVEINIRGLGVVVFLIVTVIIGALAKGFAGRSALRWGEGLLGRVPVVRPVYGGLKQIAQTVFVQDGARFERMVLVEFPRPGLWSVAFVSAPPQGAMLDTLRRIDADAEWLGLFRPMTPNATAGFLLYVRASEVRELDLSLEDAAKLVISAGLVYPPDMAEP